MMKTMYINHNVLNALILRDEYVAADVMQIELGDGWDTQLYQLRTYLFLCFRGAGSEWSSAQIVE